MHARAYKAIGYRITVCSNGNEERGQAFANAHGAEFVRNYEDVCRHPEVDYVDVCTFPSFRLQAVELCAQTKKHVGAEAHGVERRNGAAHDYGGPAGGHHARGGEPAPV